MNGATLIDRRLSPLLQPEESPAPRKASQLSLLKADPQLARTFVAAWHSRLPVTNRGPWMLAFVAHYEDTCFGAALWHNPSARTLPNDWLELRRLAIPDDAPPHTASWMLGAMRRWIATNRPQCPRLISYQDMDVHTGTIYKAAGWSVANVSESRTKDRTVTRPGSKRLYRWNQNGEAADSSAKARWEIQP